MTLNYFRSFLDLFGRFPPKTGHVESKIWLSHSFLVGKSVAKQVLSLGLEGLGPIKARSRGATRRAILGHDPQTAVFKVVEHQSIR